MKPGEETGENIKADIIVAGGSSGGLETFMSILDALSPQFSKPIVFVLHQSRKGRSLLTEILQHHTNLIVKEPVDKENIEMGNLYVAPPDYHLQMEPDGTLSYAFSEPLHFSRPSIDILFETAAASGRRVAGVLLTGANSDGAAGLARIQKAGGIAIVQDPETAKASQMPAAAIQHGCTRHILSPPEIATFLNIINKS